MGWGKRRLRAGAGGRESQKLRRGVSSPGGFSEGKRGGKCVWMRTGLYIQLGRNPGEIGGDEIQAESGMCGREPGADIRAESWLNNGAQNSGIKCRSPRRTWEAGVGRSALFPTLHYERAGGR